jgi:hypothetical protein
MNASPPPQQEPPLRLLQWQTKLRGFYRSHYRFLQGFFHWNYSGGLILFFLGAVLTFGSLREFKLACWSDALFLFWSVGFWLTSEQLEKIGRPKKRKRSQLNGRKHRVAAWGGCIVAALVAIGAGGWIRGEQANAMEEQLRARSGILQPANLPNPPNRCGEGQPGQVIVTFGTRGALVGKFPINAVDVGGEPLLRLDRDEKGNMLLSADIFDQEHNILASIENNKYDTDSAVFRVQRDDLSSLTVFARKDKQKVLDVRYLNPRMITVNGVFRSKTHEVVASPDGVTEDGMPYRADVCVGYAQGKVAGALYGFDRE